MVTGTKFPSLWENRPFSRRAKNGIMQANGLQRQPFQINLRQRKIGPRPLQRRARHKPRHTGHRGRYEHPERNPVDTTEKRPFLPDKPQPGRPERLRIFRVPGKGARKGACGARQGTRRRGSDEDGDQAGNPGLQERRSAEEVLGKQEPAKWYLMLRTNFV